MDGLKLSELEVGKEYFLFDKQFNGSNRVLFLGLDNRSHPPHGHFEYNNRMNREQITIHEFELGFGFSEITTEHQKGVLIS